MQPLLKFNDGVLDTAVPDVGPLVPRAWRSVIGLPCQPERVTVRCAAIVRRS